jgi:tyrosine decarboxylase/aspartate 1-decarboxylase
MHFETESLSLLNEALTTIERGFTSLPEMPDTVDIESMRRVLTEVAVKMQDNFPYSHALYAGQMQKPPHPIARLAYMLSMWINPNNHSLDGGKASSEMEKEAVVNLAQMLGFKKYLGHLCSGGTIANLEALWVASKLLPGQLIVASEQAHYTHNRICGVLNVPFKSIAVDPFGRMDVEALEGFLRKENVGMVVVTTGTRIGGSLGRHSKIAAAVQIPHTCGCSLWWLFQAGK